jgi:FKBP-type peptidyl-prolyl cis-trans isomerase
VRRLLAAFLVASSAVAGVATFAGAAPSAAASSSLTDVTVASATGQKPTLTFTKPFSVKATQHRELTAGAGDKIAKGATVTVDFVAVDARTGDEIQSTYGSTQASIPLDPKQTRAALVDGLVGKSVGGRELIAVAPKDGIAQSIAKSNPAVKKDDTLLFVVDPVRLHLVRAKGTAVAPVAGLPKVKLAASGQPTIKVPKTKAPTSLVVQPLIKGTGPVVKSGQTISVQYTGVIWDTNKKFDSSWDRKQAADFPIGAGQVIAGWDEGLVGQTVGSQVLLVVPPDKGYGSQGQPQGGIKGTDTLVFVVDILDAQ